MAIDLEYSGFTIYKTDYCDKPPSQWDGTTLRAYRRWAEKVGVQMPHFLALRLKAYAGEATTPPKRRKGQSLNQYRRELRAWRVQQHGSVAKHRRAAREQREKVQRWKVLMGQGLPLRDPEAILWLMRSDMWAKNRWDNGGYRGYPNTSKLMEAAGGQLPAGIDYEAIFDQEFIPANDRHRVRYDVKKKLEEARKTAKPMERLMPKAKAALQQAYVNAGFRHKEKLELIHSLDLASNYFDTTALWSTEKSTGRRNGRKTEVRLRVPLRWYRLVHLAGLAHAFGPGTLVLDARLSADGQRTMIDLAAQPSRHRYAVVIKRGYLTRDINGNHKFTEV